MVYLIISSFSLFSSSLCIFKALRFLQHRDPKLGDTLGYTISSKSLNPFKKTNKQKKHVNYTLHMYTMTHYADLSGELNEILKEIWIITSWRVLLFNIFLIFCFGGVEGGASCQKNERKISHILIQEINSQCEKYKKRIYLIIVLIYNLDGGNKWNINTYEYITNDKVFFTLEEAFSDHF